MRTLLAAILLTAVAGCSRPDPYARHVAQAAQAIHPIVPEERAARERLGREVRELLSQRRYDELDSLAASFRRNGDRFEGGYPRLRAFYEFGFGVAGGRLEAAWPALIRELEAFREARPASIVAPIALTEAYTAQAWSARGTGSARTVTTNGWRLFRDRLEKAAGTLASARSEARATLDACMAANRVAIGQGWSDDRSDSIFRAGRSIDPRCEALYEQRAYYLLPRWHGRPGDWEAFLQASLADLPRREADRIYAEVVVVMARRGERVFVEPGAQWSRVRSGLLALVERYPTSLERKSQLCWLAAVAEDWVTANAMFRALGPRADLEVWRERELFARTHLWAQAMKARQSR